MDWKKLIARPDIDLVDVCVPNVLHHDIVIAAANAGKMVVCEKPLAMSGKEAEEMVAAVEQAGVANMVSFNYRRVPAISLAKQIIGEGRIGRPFHYRATYNQDYTISAEVPQGGMALWRLDARVAGSGVTGDLLAHSIDTAEWLNGPIQRVVAHTETFIKERKHAETGKMEPVTIDDACMFLALSPTARAARSRAPATPADGRTTTPSRSTARTARCSSTWKIRTSCSSSATPTRPPARRSRTI